MTNGDRDPQGNFVLRRTLTLSERKMLQDRATELGAWLKPVAKGKLLQALISMFLGSGGASLSREEAIEVAKTYIRSLDDLPGWVIERTCNRFERGDVKPEEFGAKKMDVNFRPSTAAIRRVGVALMTPIAEESTRIAMTLHGTVAWLEDPEKRAKVQAGFEELAANLDGGPVELIAGGPADPSIVQAERSLIERSAAQRISHLNDARDRHVLAEYERKGLPVPSGPGRPQSLSLLISLGWSIQDGPLDKKILMAPPRDTKKRTNETMGDSR